MKQTPKTETAPEAPLTWTSSEEWGTVGNTHRAEVTLDNGDTWTFQVDQPRKGHWVARGWRNNDFALYREDRTMKGARAQCQAQANFAATSTCDECRKIGGHTEDCPTLAPALADGCCGDQDNPAVAHSTDGTGCWEILAPEPVAAPTACDECGRRTGHKMDCSKGRAPQPLIATDEGAALLEGLSRSSAKALDHLAGMMRQVNTRFWVNLRRPARCPCPTPTHTMRCGTGARPVVVARKGCGLDRCDPFACNDCMDCANFEGLPGHLYNESCPGTCCGGDGEL